MHDISFTLQLFLTLQFSDNWNLVMYIKISSVFKKINIVAPEKKEFRAVWALLLRAFCKIILNDYLFCLKRWGEAQKTKLNSSALLLKQISFSCLKNWISIKCHLYLSSQWWIVFYLPFITGTSHRNQMFK